MAVNPVIKLPQTKAIVLESVGFFSRNQQVLAHPDWWCRQSVLIRDLFPSARGICINYFNRVCAYRPGWQVKL